MKEEALMRFVETPGLCTRGSFKASPGQNPHEAYDAKMTLLTQQGLCNASSNERIYASFW
jgi:hypothetical protein